MNAVQNDQGLMYWAPAIIAGLCIVFQIGHFAEHVFQFAVWTTGWASWVAATFCGPDRPYMSGPANWLVALIGGFFPDAAPARQSLLGVEILHLLGNGVFLTGIIALWTIVPEKAAGWVKAAFVVEGLHLIEHILLTGSSFVWGAPYGVSTLFGYAPLWLPKEFAVGYRVAFHFLANFGPLPFVMIAIMRGWNEEETLKAA